MSQKSRFFHANRGMLRSYALAASRKIADRNPGEWMAKDLSVIDPTVSTTDFGNDDLTSVSRARNPRAPFSNILSVEEFSQLLLEPMGTLARLATSGTELARYLAPGAMRLSSPYFTEHLNVKALTSDTELLAATELMEAGDSTQLIRVFMALLAACETFDKVSCTKAQTHAYWALPLAFRFLPDTSEQFEAWKLLSASS